MAQEITEMPPGEIEEFRESNYLYMIVEEYKDKDLTLENVKSAMEDIGIMKINDAFLHIRIESGNLKSKLSTIGNNLCGMRKAKRRETFALDETYCGYATYEHWIYSLLDYWLWQGKGNKRISGKYSKYLNKRKYFDTNG